MASLFNRDPEKKPAPGHYDRERIEREIEHLSQRGSVRHGARRPRHHRGAWALTLVVILLGLFFMDPPLHSFHRNEAVRAYLYLHYYGSDKKAAELAATGIFTANEIDVLNHRQGSFQNYYSGPTEASNAADSIISYMKGVESLQRGDYQRMDPLSKFRYLLFFHFGLTTPTTWDIIDSGIGN
jgi:hypothetical protein